MEIFLNFIWVLLALASVALWVRFGRRDGEQGRLPVVALVLLLVILFPVVSVSDDLWSLQNPAEMDVFQRRDHVAPCFHPVLAPLAPALARLFTLAQRDSARVAVPATPCLHASQEPARDSIENRPPPVA